MSSILETIENKSQYLVQGIGTYYVDGVPYSGFSNAVPTWEKSFDASVGRAKNGAMTTINDQPTFNTPRYKVTYSVMPIDDFRSLMKKDLDSGKNEFVVKYYDAIYNKITEQLMYLATPEEPKYHYEVDSKGNVYLLGVDNYTVEFIGTDNPING